MDLQVDLYLQKLKINSSDFIAYSIKTQPIVHIPNDSSNTYFSYTIASPNEIELYTFVSTKTFIFHTPNHIREH